MNNIIATLSDYSSTIFIYYIVWNSDLFWSWFRGAMATHSTTNREIAGSNPVEIRICFSPFLSQLSFCWSVSYHVIIPRRVQTSIIIHIIPANQLAFYMCNTVLVYRTFYAWKGFVIFHRLRILDHPRQWFPWKVLKGKWWRESDEAESE